MNKMFKQQQESSKRSPEDAVGELLTYMRDHHIKSMLEVEALPLFPSLKAYLSELPWPKHDGFIRTHSGGQLIFAYELKVFYRIDFSTNEKKKQSYLSAVNQVIQHMVTNKLNTIPTRKAVHLCPWLSNIWHMEQFWEQNKPTERLRFHTKKKELSFTRASTEEVPQVSPEASPTKKLPSLSTKAPSPSNVKKNSSPVRNISATDRGTSPVSGEPQSPCRYELIDTKEAVDGLVQSLYLGSAKFNSTHIAIDVEFVSTNNPATNAVSTIAMNGSLPALALIQVAFGRTSLSSDTQELTPEYFCYIFDYMKMKQIQDQKRSLGALTALKTFFTALNCRATWLAHDARMEVLLLREYLQLELNFVVDTQLVLEELSGEANKGLNSFLALANMQHWSKSVIHREMGKGTDLFTARPLSKKVLQYAADDVLLLLEASEKILKNTDITFDLKLRQVAHSKLNLKYLDASHWPLLPRTMCFDGSNNYKLRSAGLVDPSKRASMETMSVSMAIEQFQNILPSHLMKWILQEDLVDARDLVLDVGRVPRLFFRNHSKQFDESAELTLEDLDTICMKLHFGKDNRAILEASLHRISAMRNLDGEIYSLTIRFGRTITGASSILQDILHGPANHSILILGPPGTGKSSLMRDMIRAVSLQGNHTIVVDTSNELCGSGNIVHPCVGLARRMMVPHLESQKRVMIEAVQNHTPDVLVIDEIGRSQEVQAAATIKRRGVRLLATAHGSFCELMKNPDLRGLLGGFQQVILSDAQVKMLRKAQPNNGTASSSGNVNGGGENSGTGGGSSLRKTITERAGAPVFDVVIELVHSSEHRQVRIFSNTAKCVDMVLKNLAFHVERRWLGKDGEILVAIEKVG